MTLRRASFSSERLKNTAGFQRYADGIGSRYIFSGNNYTPPLLTTGTTSAVPLRGSILHRLTTQGEERAADGADPGIGGGFLRHGTDRSPTALSVRWVSTDGNAAAAEPCRDHGAAEAACIEPVVPESGAPGAGRHSQPCRAGIVRKSGYDMLSQIGKAESGEFVMTVREDTWG